MTLIDPHVDPAEAPTNMSSRIVVAASGPQRVKSSVAKPVVVMIATPWKAAWRMLAPPLSKPPASSSTTSSDVPSSRNAPYSRASSSRIRIAGRRWTRITHRRRKFTPARTMNSISVHCVTGANAAAESLWLEKPPSDITEKAWATASKRFMAGSRPVQPRVARTSTATAVSATYSRHSRRAVSRIVALSFSISVGPASSRSNRCRPPIRIRGSTATASTMIPIPPSQWLSWRQNSIERSSASTSASTVAPLAVKPETASK